MSTRITDPSKLAELREMNNPSNIQGGRCPYCGSSHAKHGETCPVCGNQVVALEAACISCGSAVRLGGGPHHSSTVEEPMCIECMNSAQGMMQRMHVYVAISEERAYQDKKHGDHRHSTMEWLGIIEGLVNAAKEQFTNGGEGCNEVMLCMVRKIAATAVACMEQRGVIYRDSDKSSPPKVNVIMQSDLRKSVENTLNRFSAENGSNTPDFILAQYLMDCLGAYDKAVQAREKWYGREPKPLDPQPPAPVDGTKPHAFEGSENTINEMCRVCGHPWDHYVHKA